MHRYDVHEHVLQVQLMNRKTRGITLAALFAALAVASLYFASVWPTGQLGLTAFSSLFVTAAIIEAGIIAGINVFVICSVLGLLILPDKGAPLLFVLFFGYYPIIKSLVEKIGSIAIQWILKIVVFNIALSIILIFLREVILDLGEYAPGDIIIYLIGNAVFLLFDYGYSKVIWFYMNRISRYLR